MAQTEQAKRLSQGCWTHWRLELHFASVGRHQGGGCVLHPSSFLGSAPSQQKPHLDAQFLPWRL